MKATGRLIFHILFMAKLYLSLFPQGSALIDVSFLNAADSISCYSPTRNLSCAVVPDDLQISYNQLLIPS